MLKRTLFILVGIFIISVGIEMLVIFEVGNQGVSKYNDLAITQKQEVLDLYIENEFNNLKSLSSAHAYWSDAQNAVATGDTEFLNDQVVSYLVEGDFNIDFVYATDENSTFELVDGIVEESITASTLFSSTLNTDLGQGSIIKYSDEIYLLSGYPFATDEGLDKQGVLIIGRKLDMEDLILYMTDLDGESELHISIEESQEYDTDEYNPIEFDSIDETLYIYAKYDFGFSQYIESAITTPVLWITMTNIALIVIVMLFALVRYRRELNFTLDQVKSLRVKDGLLSQLEYSKSPELNEVIGVLNEMVLKVDESFEELMRKNIEVVKLLSTAAEINDEYTSQHSTNVSNISVKIADELGMKEKGKLELSAQLHDIGKVFIQHSLLNKKGKITPTEYEEMKKHTINGARLLNNITKFEEIKLGVLHHHERWDGSGYPSGLMGQEIPLFARIISVADVYDALTSIRPYRDSFNQEEAIAIMKDGRGKHFDPKILDVFLKLHESGNIE